MELPTGLIAFIIAFCLTTPAFASGITGLPDDYSGLKQEGGAAEILEINLTQDGTFQANCSECEGAPFNTQIMGLGTVSISIADGGTGTTKNIIANFVGVRCPASVYDPSPPFTFRIFELPSNNVAGVWDTTTYIHADFDYTSGCRATYEVKRLVSSLKPYTQYRVEVSGTRFGGSGDTEVLAGSAVFTTGAGPVPTTLSENRIGVFRPGNRQFILNTVPVTRITFGTSTDKPVTGDWDGDGKTEIGVFRSGQFILDLNNDGVADVRVNFGMSTDKPVSGDWDDDGYDEIGVFRASGPLGQFILDNTNYNTAGTRTGVASSRINFGLSSDIPVPIDWNDAGATEVAVYRQSTREFIINTNPVRRFTYGTSTDTPLRTWLNSGTTQVAVFRPSGGAAQFIVNSNPSSRYNFGLSTDIPVTGKWT